MTTTVSSGVTSLGIAGSVTLTERHLLGLKVCRHFEIRALIERSNMFADNPNNEASAALDGKTVINLFYENSTRTRYRLSWQPKGFAGQFSISRWRVVGQKGETLLTRQPH